MLAAVVRAFGQSPRLEEFPDPTPGDGEVIVQVRAAGLHPVVKALAACDVRSIRSRDDDLEEIFLRFYRDQPA